MTVARPNSVLTRQRHDVVSNIECGSALNLGIELPLSTHTPTSLTYNRAASPHSSRLLVIERVRTGERDMARIQTSAIASQKPARADMTRKIRSVALTRNLLAGFAVTMLAARNGPSKGLR